MNNRLGKFYDVISPRERLPLIQAATLRGDETERQRLVNTAPRVSFQVLETHGFSVALHEATTHHVIQQLQDIATYWRASTGQADALDDAEAERWGQLAELAAYHFGVRLEAWRQFSEWLSVDPDAAVEYLSRLATGGPEAIPRSSFSAEEIRAYCSSIFIDPGHQPQTVEDCLEEYRALFSRKEAQWQ